MLSWSDTTSVCTLIVLFMEQMRERVLKSYSSEAYFLDLCSLWPS